MLVVKSPRGCLDRMHTGPVLPWSYEVDDQAVRWSYGLSGSVLTRAFGRVTSLQYIAALCVSKKPGQTPPSQSGNLLRTIFSNCKTRGKMAAARVYLIYCRRDGAISRSHGTHAHPIRPPIRKLFYFHSSFS